MDFLKLLDGHFRVNLGGLQFLVTEQLLDEAYVRSAFEHVRCTRVPKQVATAAPANVGFFDVVGYLATEHVGIKGLTVAA